jgi:hypothetical protein
MKLKQRTMSFETWCRFNDLDASELDTNYIKYLEWKEEQCKTHQLSK